MEYGIIEVGLRDARLPVSVGIERRRDEWLVCLHGVRSNSRAFDAVLERGPLANASVLAIDFVGFGRSPPSNDFSYDLSAQAAVIEQVVDQFGIRQLHFVGHSMGGMVATLLLPRLGNRVRSFVNLEGNLVLDDCGASLDVVRQTYEEFAVAGYEQFKRTVEASSEPSALQRAGWLQHIPPRRSTGHANRS